MDNQNLLRRPRGTRDFPPEEMVIRRRIENIFREVLELYGYKEIATPTFEHAELFIKKSGEQILEEMYFFEDKSGRKLVLRPELTLPTLRFYYSELRAKPKPLKIYYVGNVFRYEEPQRGRYREFWQVGCEIIEGEPLRTFVEGLDIVREILTRLNIIDECIIRVGNIDLVREVLKKLGIGENKDVFRALDKKDFDSLRDLLSDETYKKLEPLLRDDLEGIVETFPDLKEMVEKFKKYIEVLREAEIPFKLDLKIVRGWDYYSWTVFEVEAPWLGAEKQICGGGFYDLSDVFEDEKIVSFGFAFGLDRTIEALKSIKKLKIEEKKPKIFVAPLSEKTFLPALKIARNIRSNNLICELDIKGRNIRRILEYALSNGYEILIILGEKELSKGTVSIKDLVRNVQHEVPISDVMVEIRKILGGV